MLVAGKSRAKPIDGIKRACTHVVKRPPVEWNEVARARTFEKAQGISRSQVASAKPWLPPRGMPDGKKSDVELPMLIGYMLVNDSVGVVGEGGIPSEEYRMLLGEQEIHVGG